LKREQCERHRLLLLFTSRSVEERLPIPVGFSSIGESHDGDDLDGVFFLDEKLIGY